MFRSTIFAIVLVFPFIIWQLQNSGGGVPPTLYNAVTLLILAPIAEELIFRGVLQEFILRRLKKYKILLSTLIVSLVFTAVHMLVRGLQGGDYTMAALVFFPSVVLCLHYGKYQNLRSVIVIHAVYNTTMFIRC